MAGAGFVARDLTIRNTAGPAAHQAVALRVDSDRSAFFRVAVEGHQDTLYAHSLRQFYRDCRVSGTVDFVFGGLVVCVGRTCSESNDHVSGTRCLFVSADFSTVSVTFHVGLVVSAGNLGWSVFGNYIEVSLVLLVQ